MEPLPAGDMLSYGSGHIDLRDFCFWANDRGLFGVPKDPEKLAAAFGMISSMVAEREVAELRPEAGAPVEPMAAPSASAPAVARPEPVAAPAEAVPVQHWMVKKPEKFQGYRHPLHELLKRAHAAGNARPPTAQDVLDAWSSSKPYGITRVMPDGFEFLDGTGATKEADRDAIRKAIGRMVNWTTSGR